MMNRNERMEKLNNAGVDTKKYFDLELPNGLKPGAKIQIVIDDNGDPMVVCDNYEKNIVFNDDYIAGQIITDGYVRNTKLHRRFVMAQMFHMLNYKSYNGTESGFHACLRNGYGYDYTIKMMLEEVRVLSKLEVRDKESFDERAHFFDRNVIVAVMEDYLEKLIKYVNNLPDHNCKGVPYKRVKKENIFNEDLNKKVFSPVRSMIVRLRHAKSANDAYKILHQFVNSKNYIKLPFATDKSKVWIDTYKGEGAYYTLKNLVMFHDCVIYGERYDYKGVDAVSYLERKLDAYQGKGWRMFALMKKVISDNGFDFNERMNEIYGK